MRKLVAILGMLVAVALEYGCSTAKPPTSVFQDDWTGLFLSVTKSFGVAHTYYLGSDDRWSYFKTTGESLVTPTYRKVETSRMKLSHTFPFGRGKPYQIQSGDFGYSQSQAPSKSLQATATAPSVLTGP